MRGIARQMNLFETEEVRGMKPAIIFTPIFCLILYLAAKSQGVCRVLLLVLAALSYGIYLYILQKAGYLML